MTELYNLQRKIQLDAAPLKAFAATLPDSVHEAFGSIFATALVSDRRMKELNSLFRGKDATTDVLSFPHEPDALDPVKNNLGDIVVSVEQAERQASNNKLTLEREIKQLILHGLLHLCGYDHEKDGGEMNTRELELRKKLKI